MKTPSTEWYGRHHRFVITLFVLLLVVIAAESLLLSRLWVVSKASQAHSAGLLATFLQVDTAQAVGGPGVRIRLQNVRFKWSDRVFVDADNIAVQAVPLHGTTVNFDDLESFHLVVQRSAVLIRPEVLAAMFNESIFNYPGSRVRDMRVSIAKDDKGVETVELSGKINVVAWVPFEMYTRLTADTNTNTLVIAVDHLKLFSFMPVTKLLRWTPLNIDRMIAMPPNKSLLVDGNLIMVKPFGLFPPPRINGKIAGVVVNDKAISISFSGEPIPAPVYSARNYVYLRGGTSQFGRFRMAETDVLILDQNPANPFVFSLLHYAEMIRRSKVEIPDTQSVRITMPDF